MSYLTFIPYVNERELLAKAVGSIKPMWTRTIVIDNSPHSAEPLSDLPVKIYRPPVPLSFAQSQNLMQELAFSENSPHYFYMHSDGEAVGDCAARMLDFVLSLEGRKWGAVFTNYDVFCCFSSTAVREIGRWDWRMFPWYYTDCDYFHRMRRAGYEIVASGLPVEHHNAGSNAVKHNPYLKQFNDWYMERAHLWYQYKWGGVPGKELFELPFNGKFDEIL